MGDFQYPISLRTRSHFHGGGLFVKRFRRTTTAFVLIALLATTGQAKEEQTPEKLKIPKILSLESVRRLALKNNFDIALEKMGPESAEADIDTAEAEFEPKITGNSEYAQNRTPTGSALSGAMEVKTEQFDFDLGVTQKVRTGGRYDVRWASQKLRTNSTFSTLNPAVASNLNVSVTQPLLREFGINVNEADVIIAQNNLAISKDAFEEKVINVLTNVEEAYLDFAQAAEDLKAINESKVVADNLVAEVSKKAAPGVGVASKAELWEAQADQATANENVIIQEIIVRNNLDLLLNFVDPHRTTFHPDDNLVPEELTAGAKKIENRKEHEETALRERRELRQAVKLEENTEVAKDAAENGLLPKLDLVGSTTLRGLDSNHGASFDETSTLRSTSYAAGLALEIPLGNREAKARFRKADIEQRKAKIRTDSLKAQVVLEVREAIRAVNAAIDRSGEARKAKEFSEKTLQATRDRLKAGTATTRDVIEKNAVFVQSMVRYNRAIIDYHRAVARLAKATAQTLANRNIKLR